MRFALCRPGLRNGRRWELVIPDLSAQCGVFETSGTTHPMTQHRLTNTDGTTSSQKLWDLMRTFCTRFSVQLEAQLLTFYASLTVMLMAMLCRNPAPNFGKRKSTNCTWFAFHKTTYFIPLHHHLSFLKQKVWWTEGRWFMYIYYICI
jgi:hypothetical protein